MEGNVAGGASGKRRELDAPELRKLEELIRRSFRVRENQTPVYVDVSDNLARVGLEQHQILFGRRGSGKSCLLVYFRHAVASEKKVHTIYIDGDTVKTLEYPDVLIRLLLAIFEGLPAPTWPQRTGGGSSAPAADRPPWRPWWPRYENCCTSPSSRA